MLDANFPMQFARRQDEKFTSLSRTSSAPFPPMKTVTAIYENGVFRPLEKVDLPEASQVSVVVPEAPRQPVSPSLAAIYDVMAERYDSGHHDTAEHHNEHQP